MIRFLLLVFVFAGIAKAQQFPVPKKGEKEKFGYFNLKSQSWQIEPMYSYAGDFAENGIAVVCDDLKCGCINLQGEVLIPFEYGANNFFYFKDKPPKFNKSGTIILAKGLTVTDAVYGMLDEKGNQVMPFEFDIDYANFDPDAEMYVLGKYDFGIKDDEKIKWGIVNQKGESIIPFTYDRLTRFNDSLFTAVLDKKCGLINIKNEIIIPIENQLLYKVPSGKDLIFIGQNGKRGVKTLGGKEIVPAKYYSVHINPSGLIAASNKNELFFYATDGKLLNEQPFYSDNAKNSSLHPFTTVCKKLADSSLKTGVIDQKGNEIIPFEFDFLTAVRDKYFIASKKNRTGVIGKRGEILIPHIYKYLQPFREHYFIACYENRTGVIDSAGKTILPFICDEINVNGICKIKEYYGLIDQNCCISIKAEYDSLFFPPKRGTISHEIIKIKDTIISFNKKEKCGLLNSTGKVLTEFNADKLCMLVYDQGSLFIIAEKAKKYGILNAKGEMIADFIYDTFDSDEHRFEIFKGGFLFTRGKKKFVMNWQKEKMEKRQ